MSAADAKSDAESDGRSDFKSDRMADGGSRDDAEPPWTSWSPPRPDRRAAYVACAAMIATMAAAPALGLSSFLQSLAIEIMVFSILSMSLNLLLGYTGLVSFGHAAFFAVAGYAAAVAAIRLSPDVLVTVPVGIAASSLLAVAVGFLSIRLSGFYFLMITFTFAQMVHVAASHWKRWTGGSDGLIMPAPELLGQPVLQSREAFYYTALIVFTVCCAAMYGIVTSPFGRTLAGIREHGPRMRALGYDVRRYKLGAFVTAAAFASVAGVLNAQFNLFIAPESAHWTQSAITLVMVLIGGSNFFIGPIVGTAVYLLLQYKLSSYTEYWGLVLGLMFIAFITGAREGLIGIAVAGWNRLRHGEGVGREDARGMRERVEANEGRGG
jgi:branched-chain amino acid transport system permease protein